MREPDVERIRALDDRARQSFTGYGVTITAGIAALGHERLSMFSFASKDYFRIR
jgi:hypothetical protein